ncbi:MAG: hypothetical protein ABIM99_06530 [Candidatus Dojkabacteria bacterium]
MGILPSTTMAAGKIECADFKISGKSIETVACLRYDWDNYIAWFKDGDQNAVGIFHHNKDWNVSYYVASGHPIAVDFFDNDAKGVLFSTKDVGQYFFIESQEEGSRNGWLILPPETMKKLNFDSKVCDVFTYHDVEINVVGCFSLKFGISMNFTVTDKLFYVYIERSGIADEYWDDQAIAAWRKDDGEFSFKDQNWINNLVPQKDKENYLITLSETVT